jgi:SAM-dependent methyltransferase
MKTQVKPNHYFEPSYDSKERFVSYWHQINELTQLKPNSILEIGIGNGLVSNYLKQRGYNVTSIDIDFHLDPEAVASVTHIPFANESFDVVACFEVLEHLPYEQFYPSLREIHRVSKKYAVLSLPDANLVYPLHILVPKIGEIRKLIRLPRLKTPRHVFDGQHYWEIGKAGYNLKRIMKDIERAGFRLIKTYRIFEGPYYRFFVFKKE